MKNINHFLIAILIMGILSSLLGCIKSEKKQTLTLEDITLFADKEEGFNDIFLKIIEESKTQTTHIYVAKGLYKNKIVGIKFEIKSNLPKGIESDGSFAKNGFITNPLKFISLGKETDNLVSALSELYGFPTNKKFTEKNLLISAFSLNQTQPNLDKKGNYKFKLFFENQYEDMYCELFFNVNTENKTIELLEKDDEYREALIKTLTE